MNGIAKFPKSVLAPGAAAFAAFAAAVPALHGLNQIAGVENAQWLAVAVAGLVLASLGGIRFGVVCGRAQASFSFGELALCLTAVIVAITALTLPPLASTGVLIASYLLSALWDVLAVERGLLPQWFGLVRMWFTSAAVMLLLAILAVDLI